MRLKLLLTSSILLLLVTISLVFCALFTTLWMTNVTLRVEDNPLKASSSQLTVYCNPQPMESGHVASVLGKLTNATSGASIASQTINISFRAAGASSWTSLGSAQTGINGSYSLIWNSSNSLDWGFYIINATFSGNAQFDPWTALADFQIIPSEHDLAALSIVCPHNVVGQNYSTSFTVTVENGGVFQETSNVTLIAKGNLPNTSDTIQIAYWSNQTFPANSHTAFSCTWNTSKIPFNNYTIIAKVDVVPNETDIANNNCTLFPVTVTIPGDINGDFKVNLQDLVLLANAYGTTPASGGIPGSLGAWNANADINDDNKVSLADLVILALHYEQHYP